MTPPSPAPRTGPIAVLVALTATLAAACTSTATPQASGPTSPSVVAPPATTAAPATAPGPPSVFVTPPAVSTGTPGQPRGAALAPVDRTDATAVAAAFTSATFAVDTAIDRSRFDAQARSAVWASPTYAAALTTPPPSTGDAEVTDLAAHRGFTTVALAENSDDGRPTDQLRSAARSFTVTPTGHGEDGWTQAWATRTIYVFLTRAGGDSPWQVDSAQFSATTGSGQ